MKLFRFLAAFVVASLALAIAPVAAQVLTLSQFAVDRTVTPWVIYHRANNGALGRVGTQDPTTGLITIVIDAGGIQTGTIPNARLPAPTTTLKGAVIIPTVAANAFLTGINTDGTINSRQPGFGDLSGTIAATQISANLIDYTKLATAAAHTLSGNPTGATGNRQDATLFAFLDDAFGTANGTQAPCRGATTWTPIPTGAVGTILTSLGPSVCPQYQSAPSALPSLPRRQTVLTGPVTAAAPSFLPVTNRDVLLHLDGANGATTSSDSGSGNNAPHAITFGGSAALSTAQTKFGTTSAFDGASATTNFVRIASAADNTFNSNDFTVEFWIYPTASNASTTAGLSLIGNRTAAGATVWEIGFCNTTQGASGTNICWFNTTAGSANAVGNSISLNAWHHVAVVRQNFFLTIYVDGVPSSGNNSFGASYDASVYSAANPIQLFGNLNAGVLGYIDEVSITNGYARYSSQVPTAFTPATSAYTAGGLALTFQGISVSVPLIATAAQGFNANGAVNNIFKWDTTPPSCGTLPANSTIYLALNAQSGACTQLSLVPNYQFGGQISATPGQFSFDKQAYIAYLAGTATPLVMAGEVTTNAAAITSATPYAYNGYYDSGYLFTLQSSPSTQFIRSHNLGTPDGIATFTAKNLVAENGFAVGQIWSPTMNITGSVTAPAVVSSGRLTVFASSGAFSAPWGGASATGASVNYTPASWAPRFTATRDFP